MQRWRLNRTTWMAVLCLTAMPLIVDCAEGTVERTDPSEIRLNFNYDEMTVSKAIQKLAADSGVTIEVDPESRKKAGKYLKATNSMAQFGTSTVAENLEDLLRGSTLSYVVRGEKIVVLIPPGLSLKQVAQANDKVPGVVIVAEFTKRDPEKGRFFVSGLQGVRYWFRVRSIERFYRTKPSELPELYEAAFVESAKRSAILERYNKLEVEISYVDEEASAKSKKSKMASLDAKLTPGTTYVLAWPTSEGIDTSGGTIVRGKLWQMKGVDMQVFPHSKKTITSIDEMFVPKEEKTK